MKHTLTTQFPESGDLKNEISIIQDEQYVLIEIEETSFIGGTKVTTSAVCLTKSELHSFIGTLLHVQSKLK